MMKRATAWLLTAVMLLSCLSAAVFAQDSAAPDYALTGNTGAVLTFGTDVVSVSADSTLVTTSVDGRTVTVTAVAGAVGVADIRVNAGRGEVLVQVPVGYTTFHFNGDTVTVFEGADTKYEIAGQDSANPDAEYLAGDALWPLPVSDDGEGHPVYANASPYKLSVNVKKGGGTYVFTGRTSDMSVAVKKNLEAEATLLLAGLTMSSSYTAPITVKKDETPETAAPAVYITALAGTSNALTDAALNNADIYGDASDGGNGTNAGYAESAVIKGKAAGADITLNGAGALTLTCASKNAVKVNEYGSLTVDGVSLTVVSAKNGLSCDNTVEIKSGTLNITSSDGDAIRTDPDAVNAAAGCAGNIHISGGSIIIQSASDGIQAAQDLTITGGTLDITCGSGYNDRSFNKKTMSCKGLKASNNADEDADTSAATNTITITGGSFTINTPDDALHSDAYIEITGGTFSIQTGDDGVHADTTLKLGTEGVTYNGAPYIDITQSYEGLESGTVYIYSGTYKVRSSDDGVNAAGGNDGSGGGGFNPGGGWRPGGPGGGGSGFDPGGGGNSNYSINISGGNIYVNADGDGYDSNGALNITGGYSVVWGQSSGGNAALDCDGTLLINGGTVFARATAIWRSARAWAASLMWSTETPSRSAEPSM